MNVNTKSDHEIPDGVGVQSRLGGDSQAVADLYVAIALGNDPSVAMSELKRALTDERAAALRAAIEAVDNASSLDDAREAVKAISWMFPTG